MGTVVAVDVRDPAVGPEAVDEAFAVLRQADERFSMYREDSEMSRVARGELPVAGAGVELREVLALCEALLEVTGGYFDARRHRPDGLLDPTGVVKGWAVERAADVLAAAGGRNFAINAGGDVVARGVPEPGRRWRVGIRHPDQRDRVAAVIEISDAAVATSGIYERGLHIRDPHVDAAADELLSLTVVGPNLALADAFATAAFAMGPSGVKWVAEQVGYGGYAITADRRAIWSPLVEALRAA
jgi:thiamine biosynthesis lipoprotein